MSFPPANPNLVELLDWMRALRDEFGMDSVSATRALVNGDQLTIRVTGSLVEIENLDGWLVTIPEDPA